MKSAGKSVFFFIRPKDLVKVNRICDILWSEYGVSTRIDTTDLAIESADTVKSFIEDFYVRNGQMRIFTVNDADKSYEAALESCTDLSIHTLSLGETDDLYETAKKITHSFDFSQFFVAG